MEKLLMIIFTHKMKQVQFNYVNVWKVWVEFVCLLYVYRILSEWMWCCVGVCTSHTIFPCNTASDILMLKFVISGRIRGEPDWGFDKQQNFHLSFSKIENVIFQLQIISAAYHAAY